jgi:hypothetical protein
MQQQAAVGLMLGTGLAAGGWLRVYLTNGDVWGATAISLSLFLIVISSVLAGTGAPGSGQLEASTACFKQPAWPALHAPYCVSKHFCVAGLPFALARAGIDPANAGTSIQVGHNCASKLHFESGRMARLAVNSIGCSPNLHAYAFCP